ncbi:serine-rich adhesin for platelets-like isoform X1 [Lytechinus pictus]|uniref:serine-rich adhesin for platelets-like isoform X1 n=2 Tax=Lytechinus pictus TaxID=7653 RepID=UPI0030BA1B20
MAENLVNGDADNTVQAALLTINAAGALETTFDTCTSTDIEGEDVERVKRKSHHAEIEKRRKSKLNEGINKLIDILPKQDARRSKVQILEDTYNLVVELQKKCQQLMIQNAPESEVDEIKRLMEENAKLKKEKEDWSEFLKTMNINTDIKTHMKAVMQGKGKRNYKSEPPQEQLLGSSQNLGAGQNIIIQSPTTAVMGSPNLVTMPTNQMTIPIASGNRMDGNVMQGGGNQGGMLLVTTSRSGTDSKPSLTLANNQINVVGNERPEAEGQSPLPKPVVQTVEDNVVSATSQGGQGISAITCTHEASNQSSVGQVNTTTAESKNTTAVTQVISTPITTPASQNQVLLQSGTGGGVRIVQQPPVQSQGQTVLIQLPGQPGQYIPVRIAPQMNQPQQVILTSQQGVNVVGTRGSAIQPKTPVKKKQPAQPKLKNLCPLPPDSRKPNSPIASQSSVQPIAPNTVTVRLPMNPTANQQGTVVMTSQGQVILQQPSNTILSGGVNMQMPMQVVPKPPVTQNIVYIQQNGQLIPVILQQNQSNVQQGVQQGVQQTNTIIQQGQQQQHQPQQQLKMQGSESIASQPVQSAATMESAGNQVSASVSGAAVASGGIAMTQPAPIASSQAHLLDGSTIPASSSSKVVSNSFQGNDLMTSLAIETTSTHIDQGRGQGNSGFAANDILAKATESIFSTHSETSPMQLGDLHDSHGHAANQSVIKNTNGIFGHQTTQPGIEIYDLPDEMDTSSSKGKHKKKKKKKSKSKEKEKKKKDKDKDKDKDKEKSKKINFPLPTVPSSDNNADIGDDQEMATEALLESLMQETLGTGGIDDSSNTETVMKLSSNPSLHSNIPVSSNGNVQICNYSAAALLNSNTRETLAGNQNNTTQVSSATVSSSETNGQAIFSSFNDILSNSMSVSGLPTYIDDEEDIVPGNNSREGPPCTSTASEDVPTSLSVVTSSACTQNQPSNSLSLSLPQSTDRMIPIEQKTPDSSKVATTPTSDGFQSYMSPTSFPSISSLLEQTTSAEREASISSLPSSTQKDDSPTSGFTPSSSLPFQHGWISHHSKASELARGIQPAKSHSPVSTPSLMSSTSTALATSTSMAVSTCPSVNISPPNTSLQSSNMGNGSKSSPPLNLLSQPWLNPSTDNLSDAASQPDLGSTSLQQQQQLVDILQGFSGTKVSLASQANTEVMSNTQDIHSSLPKSQPSLESLFGLPPFGETRQSTQTVSNGDPFQSISSIIDSNKTRSTPVTRDNFLGLPPYSIQTTTSSSAPVMEQTSVFQEPPLDQSRHSSSSSSSKPSNAPPSYSLINRVTAVVDKYNERKAPTAAKNVPKVPDINHVESNPANEQVFENVTQEKNRTVSEIGPVTSNSQSRYVHPKSRALASVAMQESSPAVQTNSSMFGAEKFPSVPQVKQRNTNQKNVNPKKSQLPVKNFSTATLHRTLTADISEEGGSEKDQNEELVAPLQPEPPQEASQQLPFITVPEQPQHHSQQPAVQCVQPEASAPQPSTKTKSKGSKKRQKEKPPIEPPKPTDEDSVGRRELDKSLVNRFPWLAEANGKSGDKLAGGTSQQTSNTNPSAFSVQSISQSSSKSSLPKSRGNPIRAEVVQNPPPYPSRSPAVSADSHNQSLWNPSSFDSNPPVSSASSSMISPKQTSQDRTQRHHPLSSADQSHQNNPNSMNTTLQNRQSTGNNRPPMYQASSSNDVQAAVNAAVNKATQQALLARSMAGNPAVPEKSRNVSSTKKSSQRPKAGGPSQILRQSDIDDGLDFLNSTSTSSNFPTSLSSVNMDIFDNSLGSSSMISRPSEQPSQRSGGRSRPADKQSRVDTSNPNTLLQSDFSSVPQDTFSFSQWNLEPQQTEDRENARGNSQKMQELASPPMQQMHQRGGNNCVNVNFGDSSNLGSGDDLDFSSLPSFPSNQQQQQQHTPSDRQTPQNQSYSVPSGRSSVASMEPSPMQPSPMNYNVQEGSHMSQINEMPHSNSSSRGPPSVETPSQQQRRMTQSPMVQSSHQGQGIKRAATDGHHLNVAKKAHGAMHSGRRATQQSNPESRHHSSMHNNPQSQGHSNLMQFHSSTSNTPNQSSESVFAGGEVQRITYPSQGGGGRVQESSRTKKRAPNPSDSIFARDPHEIDGTRSTSVSLLQDNWFGSSARINTTSSNETAPPTFLPNFPSSQTSQGQSESVTSSSSTSSSLISNISPSRRLRQNEMPTYLPSHLPGPILPSPPQTKGSHTRETDIASFNPMFTPSRTAGIHSMTANFPVFHEHQPPGGFNIAKSNQLPGSVAQTPFNFNNIFNESSQVASSTHVTDAQTLNHSIGLTPTVHLHGNASLPSEESVLHGNMSQRHPAQPFGLLAQNRPPMGVPTPMGRPHHQFHSSSFMHHY